eukprot:m.5585 g.5585  ORF g.5585 m.5585 type:complete len:93 (+) comp13568_c0_seq1:170-448(+)
MIDGMTVRKESFQSDRSYTRLTVIAVDMHARNCTGVRLTFAISENCRKRYRPSSKVPFRIRSIFGNLLETPCNFITCDMLLRNVPLFDRSPI